MSCPPVYLDEIPAGDTDPELAAALEHVASAPEELPLAPELWERLLSLIETRARDHREKQRLPSAQAKLRRGWAGVDVTPLQWLAPPSISWWEDRSDIPAGFLIFPAIIERHASPWSAPDEMRRAILERPEVRGLIRQRGGLGSNWPDTLTQITRLLARIDHANPEDVARADSIRSQIDGRGIDCFDYRLAAILAALELGRKIGRAETLEDPAVHKTLDHGEVMERPVPPRTPWRVAIDEARDAFISAHATVPTPAKLRKWMGLFPRNSSDEPLIDRAKRWAHLSEISQKKFDSLARDSQHEAKANRTKN